MPYLFNVLYVLLLVLLSPWLLYRALATTKFRRGTWAKLTGSTCCREGNKPCVWFHGVSVGEIHLLRQVVAKWRQRHPDWDCVVSTTTDTGYEEALKNFPDLPVIFWPLDFSWSVTRALKQVRPDLVVLAEAEIWPNFLWAAGKHGVRLAVINARMSPRSFARFRKIRWLVQALYSRLDLCAAQTEEYASQFRMLGARNVLVTGSIKYDGASSDRNNLRTLKMRELLGFREQDLVWVAGSTQAPEEEIALEIFRKAKEKYPDLRLIIVPRQKDRFEEVANLLSRSGQPFLRRSLIKSSSHPVIQSSGHPVILLDTIGELGAVWGLADVAFVGGSLDGRRGGQNMIEPAAYGAAVTFGPHIWNFKETVSQLLRHGAAVQVADGLELERTVMHLLGDWKTRQTLGQAARTFVQSQQGATEKTLHALEGLIDTDNVQRRVA